MKHFLKVIWSFVRKLPKQVTSFIKPNKQTSAAPIHQNEEISNSKLPKRKIKKRLKTFKSFLKDEEQILQRSRRRRERIERKRRYNRMIRSSLINSSSVDNLQSFEEEHNKESFTNEIELAYPVVFQDNDGFEISVILPEVTSPEKVQKEAADSDQQLLHLINGQKEQSKNTYLQPISYDRAFCRQKSQQNQEQYHKKPSGYNHEHLKTVKYSFNPEDDSLQSQQGNRLPSGEKKKKLKYKKQLKQQKSRLKVINLVDLVSNQDYPPVYQIPLYVEQTR